MCIAAFSFNPFSEVSLVLGFNRDEYYLRKSMAPDCHWNTQHIIAPKDCQASGTWIGYNSYGLVVCLLNKYKTINDVIIDGRSRGLLVLDVLKQKRLDNVLYLMEVQNLKNYRPFSLLVFSHEAGYCFSNYNHHLKYECSFCSIAPGNHLITHTYLDDQNNLRIAKNMKRNTDLNYLNNDELYSFLSSCKYAPQASMVQQNDTWGTVSTSIIHQTKTHTSFDYYLPDTEKAEHSQLSHINSMPSKRLVYANT